MAPASATAVEPEGNLSGGGALAPLAEAARGAGGKASSRLVALDLMRGFIMVIMAWDHSKDIFSSQNASRLNGREGWQGLFSGFDNRWDLFMARAVSNLCAPGFFWVSGLCLGAGLRCARVG
jgi:uncharacterized membrane protein